ncbi:UDP-N-acetylglucosamine 2-epimerase [Candidatus Merdisoma sp. JLR.KK011]|jgi:GDP/UDP-N,N'-diacetylbacillosamine 2-epimerase (hydrolysing)|uniref:UDP-N-acetylglucosamine 2-epimerase n=1 Tax=Candidatus Merdisoma sp. JLR.KK011 TaxID=3114299 RepID=UPI002FF35455
MRKHICVVTATRAEYGLLSPIIKKLEKDQDFRLSVAVTGMHLSPEFGLTYQEIERDGIHIEKKIEILLSADTPAAISKSMGLAMIGFADYFAEAKPDAVMLLGDRYETLAVACAAMNEQIPIIHLHGGETTEGLIDEAVRHSITKMSYLHFTSTESYRRRVIQMGEEPDRVFNVGAAGVENVHNAEFLSLSDLEKSIGCRLGSRYAVGTFHPVTLENATAESQMMELLKALDRNSDITYLFTKANADADGRVINELLEDYAKKHDNFVLVDSLGMRRYLTALKYALFVIGNSSSGLIEAPSFHIPTINIGDRQKGRIAGDTVIQCAPETDAVDKAVKKALSEEFRKKTADAANPYGDGNTSDKIIEIVRSFILNNKVNIKKKFYDIEF